MSPVVAKGTMHPENHLRISRKARAHRHSVTVDGTFKITDRCLSGLLWTQVARAVCQGKVVQVDGMSVRWDREDAYAYLRNTANRQWWRDLTPPTVCEWFALCTRAAVGTVAHPVLGEVPACQHCVDKLDLQDRLTRFTP